MVRLLREEKGVMIASIYVFVAVLVTIMAVFFWITYTEVSTSGRLVSDTQALCSAEAGVDCTIHHLIRDGRGTVPANLSGRPYTVRLDSSNNRIIVSNAAATFEAWYPVTPTPGTGETADQLTITSAGTAQYKGANITRVITAAAQSSIDLKYVTAAVRADGDVRTLGNFTADGRDHDANGNLTGTPGLPGISTTGDVDCDGSSQVGGRGFAPVEGFAGGQPPYSQPHNGEPLPPTPEEILGVDAHHFDGVTKVNDPAHFPVPGDANYVAGVYYLTSSAAEINLDALQQPAILIAHSSDPANPAVLFNPKGTFKGIIVADEIRQITGQTTIIGAVVSKFSEHTLGMGIAKILYSSEVIKDLSRLPRRWKVTTWKDARNV
ncbi:MAG: hypothetical protein PHE61_04840 [Candidatus Omnitrophica bacterium]|nr:hypothetical protein [Candidatus Omnitrophota bacterium]